MDLATLLDKAEENLKLWQINVMHVSIMDLLGDPGNPLYAELHSMAEHYDAMLAGARALGNLPERTHCRDSGTTARVHEDEAQQVCQKILRCLDMRVMDGDLVVLTCLRTPTLILLAGHFVQLYYDPDAQGQYTSHFPTGGQGFLQPRGDIRTSIVPRNFRILPANVQEVVDLYFHREGLEAEKNQEIDDCMSTDTEATNTVRRLQLHCPVATASLQMAVHEALALATAARPQEEYHYDSDDSVLDLDEEYPDMAEQVVQWRAACQITACAPPWRPSDFGRSEQSHFNTLPDLRELLNQAEEARARKRTKTPPQPDPYDAPDVGRSWAEQNQSQDRGRSRTWVDRQLELDWTCSKSRKRSKSRRRSKSRKRSKSRRRSKSHKHDEGRGVINTNPVDQEFGHHSLNQRRQIGPRGVPHKRTYGVLGTGSP